MGNDDRLRGRVALVTGALGCLGAWTAKAFLDEGAAVVAYDLRVDDPHRLRLVLGEDAARVTLEQGDVTDVERLGEVMDRHGVTCVVHLAGLQVPFCRANPPLGARVNVEGTVAVFEAVKRRRDRIPGVALASSAAVYGPDDPSPAPEVGPFSPRTHYGVFKLANEGTARIYWADDGIPSIAIRPYVVYGPARDQGLTSTPTLAMQAAARGDALTISYGGAAQYDYAPDVGLAFARASAAVATGAIAANYPGVPAHMAEVVAAIEAAAPDAAGMIRFEETGLPFPAQLEATALERAIGPLPRTPLADGVRQAVEHFRRIAS